MRVDGPNNRRCSWAGLEPSPASTRTRDDVNQAGTWVVNAISTLPAVDSMHPDLISTVGRTGASLLPEVDQPDDRSVLRDAPSLGKVGNAVISAAADHEVGHVESIGMPGLHVHDLRHTGNQFAAQSGAALRDLMARMGHDSDRAAMIYQHEARGADKTITDAIDTHVQAEQAKRGNDEDGPTGVLVPAG
jgi:hypothetical protein